MRTAFHSLQSYKAPSRKRSSGDLHDQAYKSTEQLVAPILAVAKKYGATIFFTWIELRPVFF